MTRSRTGGEREGRCRSAHDVGARRLPPVRHRDGLGRSAPSWSQPAGSRAGSTCSTSRPARATSRSAPPRPARPSSPPTLRRRTSPPGGARPRARGLELEWVEADAEALPFAGDGFDVVTSSFGAIFAPDHQAVAGELVRVCRPGGTIGDDRTSRPRARGRVLRALRRHAPAPPPGALPPVLWGSEPHVRELFGDRRRRARLTRRSYVERGREPALPTASSSGRRSAPRSRSARGLAGEPDRAARSTASSSTSPRARTRARPAARAEYRYEYLLVIARKPASAAATAEARLGN